MAAKKLYRSRENAMIAGVCAGLAEYFDIDPTLVRLATVLLIFPGGLSLWAYIIGWIIIPQKPLVSETASGPVSGEGEATAEVPAEPGAEGQDKSGTIIGIVLVVLGFLFLLNASDIFRWFSFSKLWPIILIVIGIAVLVKALNKGGTNAS